MNGSDTCCNGSVNASTVFLTLSSCDLLNAGSSGNVEMDAKCCANVLRLSTGEAAGRGLVNGGSGCCVEGIVRCHAVHIT